MQMRVERAMQCKAQLCTARTQCNAKHSSMPLALLLFKVPKSSEIGLRQLVQSPQIQRDRAVGKDRAADLDIQCITMRDHSRIQALFAFIP